MILVLLVVPPASAMAFRPSDVTTPPEEGIPARAPETEPAPGSEPVPPPVEEGERGGDPRAPAEGPTPPADPAPAPRPEPAQPDASPAPTPPPQPRVEPPTPQADVGAPGGPKTKSGTVGPDLQPECADIECARQHIAGDAVERFKPADPSAELRRTLTPAEKSGEVLPIPERRIAEPAHYAMPVTLTESRFDVWPVESMAEEVPSASIAEPEGTDASVPPKTRPVEPAHPAAHTLPRIVAASALGALLLALLYSRIARRDEALRSDRRARIIELLQARGPMALPDLTREMGCDRTTVTHHLRLLSRLSHVVIERVDGRVVAALPGQSAADALAPRAPEIIERLLREHGGQMTRAELHAAAADLPLRTRNHALAKLAHDGRIMRILRAGTELVLLTSPQNGGVTAA